MTKDRFYLNTPYSEKELVKQLEARWDPEEKKWYVPEYKDRNLLKDGGLKMIPNQRLR